VKGLTGGLTIFRLEHPKHWPFAMSLSALRRRHLLRRTPQDIVALLDCWVSLLKPLFLQVCYIFWVTFQNPSRFGHFRWFLCFSLLDSRACYEQPNLRSAQGGIRLRASSVVGLARLGDGLEGGIGGIGESLELEVWYRCFCQRKIGTNMPQACGIPWAKKMVKPC
jgi:hypothetical protein